MAANDKPLVWLAGEIRTPPFSREARTEAGYLLRRLQRGESLGMPYARPMPGISKGCLELRVRDESCNWRIIVRLDSDAIVVADVFSKKSGTTPKEMIRLCRERFSRFDRAQRKRKQ